MLKTVTITGADDRVDPVELSKLSQEFPFVEFGILVSKDRYNTPRYPSIPWLRKMHSVWTGIGKSGHIIYDLTAIKVPQPNLSIHLCGSYARELVKGNGIEVVKDITFLWDMFRRCQVNLLGSVVDFSPKTNIFRFDDGAIQQKDFIFQYGTLEPSLFMKQFQFGLMNLLPLFDRSGGKGIHPETWPKPDIMIGVVYAGYAGGISPDNIEKTIIELNKFEVDYWIDMESGVRTNDEFDLEKVRRCLSVAAKYVSPNA